MVPIIIVQKKSEILSASRVESATRGSCSATHVNLNNEHAMPSIDRRGGHKGQCAVTLSMKGGYNPLVIGYGGFIVPQEEE
jgi:hypothetical protein